MAKLTVSDAARVAGVARSTLHRAIRAGRLSADADGRLDTAELLRAGYTLQGRTQQARPGALQSAPLRSSDVLQSSITPEIQALSPVHQERDLLRLERDLLRREMEAAQAREQAALEREKDAREREALLLRMVEQVQQQNQRLLDVPHHTPAPRQSHEPPPPSPQLLGTYDPQAAASRIQALRQQGRSYEAIAAQLTAEGLPTRYGLPWQHSSVRHVLKTYGEHS